MMLPICKAEFMHSFSAFWTTGKSPLDAKLPERRPFIKVEILDMPFAVIVSRDMGKVAYV